MYLFEAERLSIDTISIQWLGGHHVVGIALMSHLIDRSTHPPDLNQMPSSYSTSYRQSSAWQHAFSSGNSDATVNEVLFRGNSVGRGSEPAKSASLEEENAMCRLVEAGPLRMRQSAANQRLVSSLKRLPKSVLVVAVTLIDSAEVIPIARTVICISRK